MVLDTPRRRATALSTRPELALIPLTFIVATGLWELIVRVFGVPAFILPPPSAILEALIMQLQQPIFWRHLAVTTQETLIGFLIGVAVALVLGTAISQLRLLEKTIMPFVVAFQTIPKVALAPLFVVWFGFGMTSKIVMAAVISFFPMLVNVIEGLRSADPAQVEMLRSFGAKRGQIFRMVRVPNAMPFFMAGLDIGIVFAILGAVVGEFIGAQEGLGYLLLQTNYNFDIAGMFAVLIVLSAMGIIAHALLSFVRRKLAFWGPQEQVIGA
ncbi:ABC transporter permease [Propioniciclava coleopterorum]|nr:ABC transporter permease [Propioniciclava coleopterorum]